MPDEVRTHEATEEHSTTLIFLAILLNRMGGSTVITVDEITDNFERSAVEYETVRDDGGEPVSVRLRTLANDDAVAIYQEFNV